MGKFGFSFSWKRALGVTTAKQRVARKIGIPTTRQGISSKLGSSLLNLLFKSLRGKK